jgi:hypothetical protein
MFAFMHFLTIKNIITIACAVMILLYNWLSEIYCTPGALNSILINTENAVPIKPANKANIKYNVPMSLAFDDQNHLSENIVTLLFFNVKFEKPEQSTGFMCKNYLLF